MITTFQRATIGDYLKFYNDIVPGWVIWKDGERVGMIGISYNVADGRYWGYFDLRDTLDPQGARSLVMTVRTALEAAEHDVCVLCQERTFKTAPRLLKILGFYPTGHYVEEDEIWLRPAQEKED